MEGLVMSTAVDTEVRPTTDASRAPLHYRPYLDGLRTVAVYLVVAFHAGLGLMSGGFIGVDIFFVLSGYLVTGILVRDLAASGRIQWRKFYARRVRRILPAAIVTLLVVALVYAVVASPADMSDALGGFRAAFFYIANWHFIRQSTDYFAADVNTNPVLHFWSLAVEEQFYLVWPLALGVLYLVTHRVGRYRWWLIRAVVALATVASAIAALRLGSTNLARAYYGTDTRAYQLMLGAAVALTPQLLHLPGRYSRYARAVAVATLAGLLVLGTSASSVGPVTRGVATAILTALLIVGLENAPVGAVARTLSAGGVSYLGRISYGTYLWHWPVIVVLTYSRHLSPLALFAIAAPTATCLAGLSYYIIERPVRTSRRLDSFRVPVIVIGFTSSILVGALVIPPVLDPGHSASSAQGPLSSGSRLLDWRTARNDIAKLPDCLKAPVEKCEVVRGTGPRVMLIGDSHAQMWLPAFEAIARSESLTLSVAVMDACPWQRGLFYLGSGSIYQNCKRHQDDWYNRVVPAFDPDIIFLVQAGSGASRFRLPLTFPDGRKLAFGDQGYDAAMISASAAAMTALQAPRRQLVTIEPIPTIYPFDPINCLSRGRTPGRCSVTVDARPTSLERFYRSASRLHVTSVDLDRLVCPRLPICDAVVNNVIVRRDANGHLTATFARSVATQIRTILHARGILRGARPRP
jgi:peptidoglycan/LPS O-acetylase OafA/YrhL